MLKTQFRDYVVMPPADPWNNPRPTILCHLSWEVSLGLFFSLACGWGHASHVG